MLDGGSQRNVTRDLSLFARLRECSAGPPLLFGNGGLETTHIEGSVLMQVINQHNNQVEDRFLDEVAYSPNAPANIIYQGYMQLQGGFHLSTSLDNHTAWLTKPELQLEFKMRDCIYYMRVPRKLKRVMDLMTSPVASKSKPITRLHGRMGHVGLETIRKMLEQKVNFGINLSKKDLLSFECVPCSEEKMRRMTYKRDPRRRTQPLEKMSMNVCALDEPTASGDAMFLLLVDEATRFKWGFLLSKKGEAAGHVKTLLRRIKTKFKKWPIGLLHADQGGEFLAHELEGFCNDEGIEQQYTNGYSPQENAVVERINGTDVVRARSLLRATMLPNLLWGEALLHSIYTLNRTPTRVLGFRSPYELLEGSIPDFASLRTGAVSCKCVSRLRRDHQKPSSHPELQCVFCLGTVLTLRATS